MYTVFLCKLTYSNCCTFLQVFCLLKGKISVTIHRTKRIVEAGDMFFIPQGKLLLQRIVMAHRAYSYSLCNVEITWISFKIIVMQYIDMYCTCTCLASSIHNEFCTIGCWPCFNFHMLNSNKLLNVPRYLNLSILDDFVRRTHTCQTSPIQSKILLLTCRLF